MPRSVEASAAILPSLLNAGPLGFFPIVVTAAGVQVALSSSCTVPSIDARIACLPFGVIPTTKAGGDCCRELLHDLPCRPIPNRGAAVQNPANTRVRPERRDIEDTYAPRVNLPISRPVSTSSKTAESLASAQARRLPSADKLRKNRSLVEVRLANCRIRVPFMSQCSTVSPPVTNDLASGKMRTA